MTRNRGVFISNIRDKRHSTRPLFSKQNICVASIIKVDELLTIRFKVQNCNDTDNAVFDSQKKL